MIRRLPGWVRTAAPLPLLVAATACTTTAQSPASDAARFNGTWEFRLGSLKRDGTELSGELRLWALDGNRLQLEFLGFWAHGEEGHPASSGSVSGVAVVEHGKATFRWENEERDCSFILLLSLRVDRMEVRQHGDPCFGFNVTAAGIYRHVSADRPTFELTGPEDGKAAAQRGIDPAGGIYANPEFRRQLTGVLVRRVLPRAFERARAAGRS